MANSEYTILHRLPTPQQYHDTRKSATLTPPNAPMMEAAVQKGLDNTFACFLAFETVHMLSPSEPSPGQNPVGMGRLVGDGALFLTVCDVGVVQEHQGCGLGKRIMQAIVEYADEHAPWAYVSLVADPMGQGLYQKFGFEDTKPSLGMYRCRRLQEDQEWRRRREERAKTGVPRRVPRRVEDGQGEEVREG